MTAVKYDTAQQLPREIAQVIVDLRGSEKERSFGALQTNAYLAALKQKGWTLRALANATDVTVEAVRSRILRARPDIDISHLPEPPTPAPRHKIKSRKKPAYVVGSAAAEEMRNLQEHAKNARGTTPDDHPDRTAAAMLAAVMQQERDNGATYVQIAEAAGVSWNAVKFRLGRYGYTELPPSMTETKVMDHVTLSPSPSLLDGANRQRLEVDDLELENGEHLSGWVDIWEDPKDGKICASAADMGRGFPIAGYGDDTQEVTLYGLKQKWGLHRLAPSA